MSKISKGILVGFAKTFATPARDLEAWDWSKKARAAQLPPSGEWSTWLIKSGRGWGKTRAGAEWIRAQVFGQGARRIAIVARTAADARDVMVEGESGILACSPSWERPVYEPSKRRLTWPNGAMATTYSADEPDLLRGPQHDCAWADELSSWHYDEAWHNLVFGLRLGQSPRIVVTTTPRPTKIVRELMASPSTVVTGGSTFDNADNLAPSALAELKRRYDGTRMGRQELYGEVLDDAPGALWSRTLIDSLRVAKAPALLRRVVIGVDPAISVGEDSDETGIVGVATDDRGHAYVLADGSGRLSPLDWSAQVFALFDRLGANLVVAEVNQGGDMVTHTLRSRRPTLPIRSVHASRGKHTRAEPIAMLYEQGRVHHVGSFPELEDQLCSWEPGSRESPDRLDALVWALTELMPEVSQPPVVEGASKPAYGSPEWHIANRLEEARKEQERIDRMAAERQTSRSDWGSDDDFS